MIRRRVLLFAVVAVVVALSGAWLLWPRPPSAITIENAKKITIGMTLSEVETIMGGSERSEQTTALSIEVGDPDTFRCGPVPSVHDIDQIAAMHTWT